MGLRSLLPLLGQQEWEGLHVREGSIAHQADHTSLIRCGRLARKYVRMYTHAIQGTVWGVACSVAWGVVWCGVVWCGVGCGGVWGDI